MAYYISSYDDNDLSEYYQTPYASAYDSLMPQGSVPYSSYEPGFHNLFDYNPTPYYRAYDSMPSWSTISYSTTTHTEPKSILYDPNFYGATFDYPQTRFVVSHSVTDYGLPEFDEYDPTPYDGGYDMEQTYGKPLPPSEKTCYPRSTPEKNAQSFDGVTDVSPKSFDEKEQVDEQAEKPHTGSNTIQADEEEQHYHENGHDSNQGKPFQGEQNVDTGDKYQPWSGQGSTNENGNNYGYDKQASQYPSGSGLEAWDLCESIFGYWPCLSRYAKNANACCPHFPHEGCHGDQWKGTADYLFGSSYPYSERRDGEVNYGEPVYSYERHYQEKPLYRQVEYEED
ncbi:hypothetical protein FEM48_Zijuj01G0137900 [Ziziphus jujuba var. spinosa]|uniref:Uncharacterized protein n=1 Tax=Ziziphus jujuba var. spinosa TaxID=714518 RepID=A0A978W1M1_ZIZJJ|nr:hypothetical protein FEM48_Zijuj01G0137900 [Ziziphus jujuba var. spinosa]